MKLTQIRALIIFLSFHAIYNSVYNLKNFEIIEIPKGISDFSYKIEYSSSGLKETIQIPYIFMNFGTGLDFSFVDDKGDWDFKQVNNWEAFALDDFEEKETIKFKLRNNNTTYVSFIFLDNSKEINIDFDTFLNWNYEITVNNTYFAPTPLIFNVDIVERSYIVHFGNTTKGKIVKDEKLLYYCLKEENECNSFQELNNLRAIKGDKYKFKLNPIILENNDYSFQPIVILQIIYEIDLGRTIFETTENDYGKIFIANLKEQSSFYLYVNHNSEFFYYSFINEEQKNNIIKGLDIDTDFSGERTKYLRSIYNSYYYSKYYLIIIVIHEYTPYKGSIYMAAQRDDLYIEDNYFEYPKGSAAILTKYNYYYYFNSFSILVSSKKNMVLLESKSYLEIPTNIIYFKTEYDDDKYIFIDSMEQSSIVKYFFCRNIENFKFNFVFQNNTNDIFNVYGPDSIFMRTSSHISDFGFNTSFIIGLEEEYYLYTKKYFGNVDVYQLNKELYEISNLEEIQRPRQSYETDNYKLITNRLIIMSGYQIISYFNSYGSLYDIYMQKVNDLEYVQINTNMFAFNNLVKLFKKNKQYYLNFKVDHYIKLDSKFLYAEVIFTDTNNNREYKLNDKNKVIRNLSGDNIIVKSNEDALVYFYKIIPDNSTIMRKEFDKIKSGKNMFFTIERKERKNATIGIIRDFGFKECYPIISEKNWEVKNGISIEIATENLYDKLENTLYEDEGEKYFVYVFDSFNIDIPIFNSDKYNISEEIYIDSLFTKGNKYNFEVFPPKNEQNFYLLFSKNKPNITYQFFICENDEIKFSIVNDRGDFKYEKTINKDYTFSQKLNENEILKHKITSSKKSLFAYHFYNPEENYIKDKATDYSIFSINKLDKNSLLIKFTPVYTSSLTQYYIIAAKKDDSNNKDTFSNPCYLADLMIQNSSKIVVKTIFEEPELPLLAASIDINKLALDEKDEIVITIISNNINSKEEVLTFYEPIEFNDKKDEYLTFNINEKTNFDFDKRSKFKYEYININNSTDYLILRFEFNNDFVFLYTDGINIEMKQFEKSNDNKFEIALTKSGVYYLEFYNEDVEGDVSEATFTAEIIKSLDIIDLSLKSYYNSEQIYSKEMKKPKIYKVQNIKENKNVIFKYEMIDDDGDYFFRKPFEICNDNTGECKDNIVFYKFEKKYNYTIYIKYVQNRDYDSLEHMFIFPAYIFSSIDEKSIENIEEGYYFFSEPKILVLNLEKKGELYAYLINNAIFYYGYTNKIITKDNIDSLDLEYEYDEEMKRFYYDDYDNYKYGILIPMFKMNNYKGQVIITSLIIEDIESTFTIPAQKNALIYPENYFFEDEDDINPLYYNLLITYTSTLNNIKYLGILDSQEYTNIIPINYLNAPIYVDKNEENSKINVKVYNPRFSYFGVVDNNAFKVYKEYLQLKVYESYKIGLKDLAPFTIRVHSDLIEFDEFVNIYLSGIKEKLNIYIKKLYGPTELYECEADPIDKMDFSILTKPLSSCKNKKSIFNRLINLGNTKIFSGYLEHNSYFDGYLDFDDDNRNIELSSAYKLINRNVKNMAKYLKKDIEYILKIDSNYLAKLEVIFDEEVIIYKDKDNILLTLNSNKLTGKLEKGKFKIKSNKDAMIYFYGEINEQIKQEKIENVTDSYIEITTTERVKYVVDFGFEGYGPTNLFFKKVYDDETLYYENLYKKLQTKLIEGESLYFYYIDSDESEPAKINIKYINKKVLNNPKNDYNFYSISKSDKNKPLIIHNIEYDDIEYRITFCESKSEVTMYYQYQSDSTEDVMSFNEKETTYEDDADEGIIKLRFQSNDNFVFSYSFYDRTDRNIRYCDTCKDERIELDNLIIKDITQKEKLNIYTIKFKPNYMYSSTRYIIVIAKKDDENSIEAFSNLCYITKLVTDKEDGVKIINIYDIGEDDYINVDFDISDILLPKTEYIVGIISQELRFEKKLNCYKPKTFSFDIE